MVSSQFLAATNYYLQVLIKLTVPQLGLLHVQVLSSLTPSLMREKHCIGPIRSNHIASKLQNFRPLVVGRLRMHYGPDYFKPGGYGPGEVEFLKKPITKIGKEIVTVIN